MNSSAMLVVLKISHAQQKSFTSQKLHQRDLAKRERKFKDLTFVYLDSAL